MYISCHIVQNETNLTKGTFVATKSKKNIYKNALIALHAIAGVYAGACISIAVVDLRFLLSISRENKVLAVLSPMLKNMGSLMVPLLAIMFLLCLVFSVKALRLKKNMKTHIPFIVYLGVLGITLAVHIPINLAIFAGEVSVEDIHKTLVRWDLWHWIRTALAMALPVAVVKFYRPLVNAKT